jgi:glycosyltransferase involved in cell wall biosynthesis
MTKSLIEIFQELGHEVVVQASFGHYSYIDDYKGVKVYGMENPKQYGCDRLLYTAASEKPDIYISTFDLFALEEEMLEILNKKHIITASMLMIDSEPYQSLNLTVLKHVRYPIFPVQWSMAQIPDIEPLNKLPRTVIHLPTERCYAVKDKMTARKEFEDIIGIDLKDSKLVMVNSANTGDSIGRKNFPAIIRGWLGYIRKHGIKNNYLYLHTDVSGRCGHGIDIKEDLAYSEYTSEEGSTILFPPQIKYLRSEFTAENLRSFYNASDLFLNPSDSEGFGLCTVEAALCGTPVLVTNFGASKEIAENVMPKELIPTCLLHSTNKYVGYHAFRGYVQPEEVTSGIERMLAVKENYSEIIASNANENYGWLASKCRWNNFFKSISHKDIGEW